MYISAVSRPENVLEAQAAGDRLRNLIPAFRTLDVAEDPGAL
jgi:hypothetical protein